MSFLNFESSSFSLSSWCPIKGYTCDVVGLSYEHLPYLSPSPSHENGFHVLLMTLVPKHPHKTALAFWTFQCFFFVLQRSPVHYTHLQRTVLYSAIYMELTDLARLSAKPATTLFSILRICTSAQLEHGPFMPYQIKITAQHYHGQIVQVSKK